MSLIFPKIKPRKKRAIVLGNKRVKKKKRYDNNIIKLLKQDHKRSKRLLGNATSNSRSKYQRNLAVAYTLYSQREREKKK